MFPDLNIVFVFLGSGVITAFVGVMFGIPSLRIKGFYLAVATLAAQFFLLWLFNKVPWFTNYSSSGVISAPPRAIFGDIMVTGSSAHYTAKYLFLLVFVGLLALAAKNLTRCHLGRAWMAIRDMDIAAEIIGIKPLQTKLSAFAISSFLLRYRRGGVGVHLHRVGGASGLLDRDFLQSAVHGHYWRSGVDPRVVLRGRPSWCCCR